MLSSVDESSANITFIFLYSVFSKEFRVCHSMDFDLYYYTRNSTYLITHYEGFPLGMYVAVDIRKDSETFGKWVGIELSESNNRALWVPEGFAHGFAALEENTTVYYKTTNYYSKEYESGIIWNDKDIMIEWPIDNPIISKKDCSLPSFSRLIK